MDINKHYVFYVLKTNMFMKKSMKIVMHTIFEIESTYVCTNSK